MRFALLGSMAMLLGWSIACNSGMYAYKDDGETDTDTDTDSDTDTDTDSDADNEALVRDMIAGDLAPEGVFDEVAWGDGWPVATATDTFLFVLFDDSVAWSLVGDFNSWSLNAMTKGDGFYWTEVSIPAPEGALYKFVDPAQEYYADPSARSYTYDQNGEISYVRPTAATWHLDRWPGLEEEGLTSRDLRVYVPAGSGPWPVLYMHDGQNLFDPLSMMGGWKIQTAMEKLEPALIVGIDNSAYRMSEYTHIKDDIGYGDEGGWGDDYAALVHQHVRPHIEATYGSTGLDGVMGSSLGGLISLYIAHLYPDEYDFAGSLSGTLGWGRFGKSNTGPVMEELYLGGGVRSFVIYVDSGGDDGDGYCDDVDGDGYVEDDPDDGDNFCVNRSFADAMANTGYTWDSNLFHWWDAYAEHNEPAWAARVGLPLSLFLTLDD
ncbi:MAG: alpha/beta hydrolase [Proteobacteria bacterium]|nr:alpha/beta hydrolase [Pseudomonadota bacterium]